MATKKILLVITSADKLQGHPTGYWMEEVAAPYYVFRAAGLDVTLTSIAGGKPPVDANSLADAFLTDVRLLAWVCGFVLLNQNFM